MLRGQTRFKQGDSQGATADYSAVLQRFPDFPPAEKELARLLSSDPANHLAPAAPSGRLAPGAKASVLVESLPYIRRFWGKVVVVKYGGNVLSAKPGGDHIDEAAALASFAQDIVLMRSVGMLPVVVHGGGPQIGALMERVGKEVEFLDGLRVTDADTIDLVRMVLVGKVNRDIVSSINVHGALAVGLSGEDANLITAVARSEALGYVGDVVHVDPVIIHQLLAQGLIPVVATIGSDKSGQAFNINADTAAKLVEKLRHEARVI